jgi:NAD-dependent dihydropyrimidine dehydrogenase PreA subunit
MKRKIIDIDQKKCTGCGQCIPDCPEGALQLIEGKARLVSDRFCDGLGACIGTCPEGAITVIERDAGAYDEKAVMETIVPQGPAVIAAHLEHLLGHGETELYTQAIEYLNEHRHPIPAHRGQKGSAIHGAPRHPSFAGCPGSAERSIPRSTHAESLQQSGKTASALRHWPVQLKLANVNASSFDDADLLISADCVPFAYADFHRDFLRDRTLVIFCPKLDRDIEEYIEKLAEIFSRHAIRSITILHMEVPCCSGVTYIVHQALERAGKKIPLNEYTIKIQGEAVADQGTG